MEDIMKPNYLNLDSVCKMLNLSASTIYAKVGKNQIPCIKLGGKLLFPEDDLVTWLNNMKQPVVKSNKQ
jgi:excisionase family DNA binding protein